MAHKYKKNYDEGYSDDRYRKGGFRGRGGTFKTKGRGRGRGFNASTNRMFENALSGIRSHGRYSGDKYDFDELIEQDPQKWFKLSVIFGAQVEKEWIVSKIVEISNEDIRLVNYQIEGKNVVAYMRTRESVVRTIRRQQQSFVDSMGKRLTINLTPVVEPSVSRLTEKMEETIKECLKSRYDSNAFVLNLNDFHKDQHVTSEGFYLPLSRQIVSQFVVGLLVENLSESQLHGLNLSYNMLDTLVNFRPMTEKFVNLKQLNLSYNRLRNEGALEVFKPWSLLESLEVQGNPFVKTHNIETFGNLLRRKFPNLLKLNGKDLPPRMRFGVSQSSKVMPESSLGYFPTDELKTGVLNFLKEYFDKYDSGKRSSLLDIYAEDSVFTLSVSPASPNVEQKCHRYDDAYFSISRNLLRVKGDDRRKKMVTFGKLQAVSVLDRLPKTQHILDSFRVDILYHNLQAGIIFFNLVGAFRELEENTIRLFSRTMQVNAPSTIKIDNLIIMHASTDVVKKYRDLTSTVKSSPVTSDPPPPAPQPSQATPSGEYSALVRLMMEQSGMNEQFSRQCLIDYNYDFKSAIQTFMALKEANKIPPEAFVKQ